MTGFARSADGTQIAYEVHGAGWPALVFVHGWTCHRGYWDGQLKVFCAGALTVAVDLAGHGESGATREDWSMAAFGADVSAVVDELGLESVVLIGHSMGGDVILEAARQLKGRVCGLVSVDEHSQLSEFPTAAEVRKRVAPFRKDFVSSTRAFVRSLFPASADASLVERVSREMSAARRQMALSAMESTWNYARDVPKRLAELKLPVVAINAPSSAEDIASLRRHGIEVVTIDGAGHFPMLERPEAFNACLNGIVARFGKRPPK